MTNYPTKLRSVFVYRVFHGQELKIITTIHFMHLFKIKESCKVKPVYMINSSYLFVCLDHGLVIICLFVVFMGLLKI